MSNTIFKLPTALVDQKIRDIEEKIKDSPSLQALLPGLLQTPEPDIQNYLRSCRSQ